MKTKHALLIFLLALVIRIGYVVLDSHGADEINPRFDSFGYHTYAVNLLDHHRFETDNGYRATRMPGYPAFLALVYALFGRSVLAVQLIQAALSALACVLIAFAASRFLPFAWAVAAGIVASVYFDFFAGVPRVLSETLYIFFLSTFFFVLFERPAYTRARIFVAGCVLGMCGMIRPEATLFGALVAAGLVFFPAQQKRSLALFFCAGIAIFVGAWTVRNHAILGKWIPSTTRGGASVYCGFQRPLTELGLASVDTLTSSSSDEIEDDRLFYAKARQAYSQASWRLIMKIWLYGVVILLYPFHPWYDWTLVFCWPFWLSGMWFLWQRSDRFGLTLMAYVLSSSALYIVVGGIAARYREPLAPGLVLLAAAGGYFLFERFGKKIFQRWACAWLAVNLVIWIGNPFIRQTLLSLKGRIW